MVSLNRYEETLLGYLHRHADEERFWRARVLEVDGIGGPVERKAATLESELREYAAERARTDTALYDSFGAGVVRLRNLAEHLLKTWTPPRAPRKK